MSTLPEPGQANPASFASAAEDDLAGAVTARHRWAVVAEAMTLEQLEREYTAWKLGDPADHYGHIWWMKTHQATDQEIEDLVYETRLRLTVAAQRQAPAKGRRHRQRRYPPAVFMHRYLQVCTDWVVTHEEPITAEQVVEQLRLHYAMKLSTTRLYYYLREDGLPLPPIFTPPPKKQP
jgi:hypothetical protein